MLPFNWTWLLPYPTADSQAVLPGDLQPGIAQSRTYFGAPASRIAFDT
jgi:hypothetical protein